MSRTDTEPTPGAAPIVANGRPGDGADERLAALLAAVSDAILMIDREGRIESANPAAESLFGHPLPILIGTSFATLIADAHRREYQKVLDSFAAGYPPEMLGMRREVLGQRSDGSSFALELSLSEMPVPDRDLLLAVARDIGERKRLEAHLRRMADLDSVTGLLNRRSFETALARHLDYASRYGGAGSLLLLDVDSFKYVNDAIGTRGGDELLQNVAGLIRSRLRKTDVLARLGGNQFAVLIHAAEGREAHAVAHELGELIGGHPFVLDRRPIRITVSIGIAPLGEQRLTAPEFLGQAEVAMYAAKDEGRDRVVEFTRQSQTETAARHALSEQIRQATERGLFVLVCQPILDLTNYEVTQNELLLRMRGEDGQLLAPASFLATAERFGLIRGIDRWVAQQAIRLLASHQKQARELVLEVNLSALSMNDPGFSTHVARELIATGIDPSRLVFEVTETAAIADLDVARRFAESLTQLGCRFALDDFGAGFASFYNLKHLPVSYLKIDGEFIRELVHTPADQLLVKAMVEVSQGLGIETIAEFVEDEQTLELVRELGVDYAQGFHIGRPAPVAELREDDA